MSVGRANQTKLIRVHTELAFNFQAAHQAGPDKIAGAWFVDGRPTLRDCLKIEVELFKVCECVVR